jgi:hypothetical protein
MVRNECIRFGGHVGIQVNYKILQLEVQEKAPITLLSREVVLRQVWIQYGH